MTEKEIIPFLLRNKYSLSDIGPEHVNEKTLELIPSLYDSYRTRDTKKGQWQIHERRGFQIPYFLEEDIKSKSNGFCAVYEKEGQPMTLFLGDFKSQDTIDFVVDELSSKVLEQRRWFAWPPKKLTMENGHNYGLKKGFATLLGVGGLTLVDAGLCLYSSILEKIDYKGVIVPYIEKNDVSPNNTLFFLAGVLAMIAQIPLQAYIFQKLGPKADEYRIKNLPEEALSYFYGHQAEVKLIAEHGTKKQEIEKSRLYDELERNNVQISKPFFAKIFNMIKTSDKESVDSVRDYIAQNHKEEQVPLDKLVNVFSSQ